jgi:hypothetical protein
MQNKEKELSLRERETANSGRLVSWPEFAGAFMERSREVCNPPSAQRALDLAQKWGILALNSKKDCKMGGIRCLVKDVFAAESSASRWTFGSKRLCADAAVVGARGELVLTITGRCERIAKFEFVVMFSDATGESAIV